MSRFSVRIGAEERTFTVSASSDGRRVVRAEDGTEVVVEVLAEGAEPVVTVDGRVVSLVRGRENALFALGARAAIAVEAGSTRRSERAPATASRAAHVHSPMPGRVVRVLVSEGQAVEAGAAVVVVEAMKMENELSAGRSGSVRRVAVKPGDAVERDALLVEID